MFKGFGRYAILIALLNVAIILGVAWGVLALLKSYGVI